MISTSISDSKSDSKLTVHELCQLSILAAFTVMAQYVMSFIPNVHITAMLMILISLIYRRHTFYYVFVYCLIEGILFGFGLWLLSYLYIWSLFVGISLLLPADSKPLLWAVIAGLNGVSFGLLCALPYLFIGGWESAFSYWLAGIPFDLIHGISNFVITLVLIKPLHTLFLRISKARHGKQ